MTVFFEWKKGALSDINNFKITSNPRQPLKYSKCKRCFYRSCIFPCLCAPCYCSNMCTIEKKHYKQGVSFATLCIESVNEPLQEHLGPLYTRFMIPNIRQQLIRESKECELEMYEVFSAFFQVMNNENISWKYKMIDWLDDQLKLFKFVYASNALNALTPILAPIIVLELLEKRYNRAFTPFFLQT